ncbi:MAG TPA: hypothetical protein VH436_32530 [Vicinamibacterales bacterium]
MKHNVMVGIAAAAFLVFCSMAMLGAAQGRGQQGQTGQQGQSGQQGQAGQVNAQEDQDTQSRVQAGLDYAKSQGITLNLTGKNRSLVAVGSYLVNAVGGCNDCHTAPPYTQDPFASLGAPKQINVDCYLAGGTAFGPTGPVSRDLTPFEDGKPAGLTLDEFIHVIRTGEDPDNPGQVLQVMPWPVYQSMTDRDLRAIYEYLSSIPAIAVNTCGVPSE